MKGCFQLDLFLQSWSRLSFERLLRFSKKVGGGAKSCCWYLLLAKVLIINKGLILLIGWNSFVWLYYFLNATKFAKNVFCFLHWNNDTRLRHSSRKTNVSRSVAAETKMNNTGVSSWWGRPTRENCSRSRRGDWTPPSGRVTRQTWLQFVVGELKLGWEASLPQAAHNKEIWMFICFPCVFSPQDATESSTLRLWAIQCIARWQACSGLSLW